MTFDPLTGKCVKEHFYHSSSFTGRAQFSPVRPYDKSNVDIKISAEYCWNNTDRGQLKYSEEK